MLHTQQAYLDELFSEGILVWDAERPMGSIFDEMDGELIKQSLKPLANGGAGSNSGAGQVAANTVIDDPTTSKSTKFRPTVSLSNARVGMDAKFTGDLKNPQVRRHPLRGEARVGAARSRSRRQRRFHVWREGAVDEQRARRRALREVGEPERADPDRRPDPADRALARGGHLLGDGRGRITATSRVYLRGHTAAGFNYNGGLDIDPIYEPPTLQAGHDFIGVTGKASLIGECAVQGVVSLLAFDAVGLEGAVGPYASLQADVCVTGSDGGAGGGFTLYERHGLRVDVDGRLRSQASARPRSRRTSSASSP